MREARVYYKGEEAGILTQKDDGSFVFRYLDKWFSDRGKPAISLTIPKTKKEHFSKGLFPFFYNILPEGGNKREVCREFKIDKSDDFGILLHTAEVDTVGAVTLKRVDYPLGIGT